MRFSTGSRDASVRPAPSSNPDFDAEDHPEDEQEIDHDGRIESDAEAEGPHVRIIVIAGPEQDASDQKERREDDERTCFLLRAVEGQSRIADEIEDELLDRVENEP